MVKRLGGWQCWVDVHRDYVIKTPKNREEIKEEVKKFLAWKNKLEGLDKRTNKMISDIKDSTKIIKKLLKRNDLKVSMRKLCYVLKDLLLSGSIPIKVENKSERFWMFNPDKFEVNLKNKLEIQEGEEE